MISHSGTLSLPDRRSVQALLFLCLLLMPLVPARVECQDNPDTFDAKLYRSINGARSPFIGHVVNITDYTAEPAGYALPLLFMGIGSATRDEETFDTGYLLAGAEISTTIIIQSLKHIVSRDRPYVTLRNVYVGHLSTSDEYSYPSGHSGTVAAIATMLALRYPKTAVVVPVIAWAALVGYGRIYLGLHYPGDVLSGLLIGAGSSAVVYLYRERLLKLRHDILGDHIFFGVRTLPDGGGLTISYNF